MTPALHAAFSNALGESPAPPDTIQYMPSGRHRIRASQAGKPLTVEVTVDASTAATLQNFLAAKLSAAQDGRDDRPFFDFNHEDREAAAWPVEFFWAGDDPKTGGVRAKIEWSDAGRRAVEGRTFRRFSPTFHLDAAGRVTGSEINMGGLVNRAAFKRIAPLFASATPAADSPSFPQSLTPSAPRAAVDTTAAGRMQTLLSALRSLSLIEASATDESEVVTQLNASVAALKSEITNLKSAITASARQRAEAMVDAAVRAGRIAAKDTDARGFWIDAILRDESRTVKALEALPINPVLARITGGTDEPANATNLLSRQEQKLATVRATHPSADFSTIYAKAKAEAPDLFR